MILRPLNTLYCIPNIPNGIEYSSRDVRASARVPPAEKVVGKVKVLQGPSWLPGE